MADRVSADCAAQVTRSAKKNGQERSRPRPVPHYTTPTPSKSSTFAERAELDPPHERLQGRQSISAVSAASIHNRTRRRPGVEHVRAARRRAGHPTTRTSHRPRREEAQSEEAPISPFSPPSSSRNLGVMGGLREQGRRHFRARRTRSTSRPRCRRSGQFRPLENESGLYSQSGSCPRPSACTEG